MKKSILNTKLFLRVCLTALLLTVGLGSCQLEDESFDGILGSKAPNFTLSNQDGEKECLLDYKNKVVVLYFFGNSCANCIEIAPEINRSIVEPFSNRTDFAVLGLDFFNGSAENVSEFQKRTNFQFPLFQNASNVASNYKTAYNRIVVIDKELNVVFSGTRNAGEDLTEVNRLIERLLTNK